MTGNPNCQVWLTSAPTESDVPKALTLCFSLKRVLTCRKVGVIASRKLHIELIESLRQCFDYLFFLEDVRNTARLKEQDFIKLFPLTLKTFEMCVFLSPTMMVLQNCDKIFDECRTLRFSGYLLTDAAGMDVFVTQPSWKVYANLMNGLVGKSGTGWENYIRNWVAIKNDETCKLLTNNYNYLLSSQSLPLSGSDDVLIVNTRNISLNMNTKELGLFTKLILKQWNTIYLENVQPLLNWIEKASLSTPDAFILQPTFNKEPIAIVGMSCQFPGANNLEEFWNILLNKKDATGNPPDYRWLRELTPFFQNDYRKTNAGFLQTPVEEFDAKFFGISPSEMAYLDPQHRLLLQMVWEALEDAAVDPKRLSGTNAGVFLGTWTNDYKDFLTLSGDDHYYRKYMGNSIGAAAARIGHFLEITGPSIATESGCSASMMAVHLACRSLQLRETNFAFACGVNLLLRPCGKDMMPAVLSEDGLCKTFDEKADGFARAEGCGVLVLKRLSEAVRDGDKIWALIRGSGVSQEGLSKSMGTPTVHSESLAMEMALRDAQVQPEQVSYVETHGTGTPVGDPMEIASIAKAYHSKFRKEPLLVGSVKTNVGHTESVSGIAGIMKVVLAMQHEIIPPHRNLEKLNPAIDLDAVPAIIPLEPVAWPKLKGEPRFAGVSSFGITGTDTHAIIEESPQIHNNTLLNSSGFERPLHIMKLSAKTKEALNLLVVKYGEHFNADKNEQDWKDLCFTANTGRADFVHRAVVLGSSKEEVSKLIEKNNLLYGDTGSDDLGKICLLFTGQGSQYPGMAKQLYHTSPVFRMHFEYCEKILKNEYNIDIAQVLWSEEKSNEVSRTIYSQTSIFCVEYALLKLWESWGVKADYALGHSLGEFAAAVCAGILTVEDAIKLVAERSRLIDQLPQGKMLVIKAEKTKVDSILNTFAGNDKSKALDYAAINSSEQTVVAGDSDLVLEFSETCKQAGLKCIVLQATHAFHSKHMDPMLNDYRKVAQSIAKLNSNSCNYISGVKGKLIDGKEVNAEYWVEHTREKVLFLDASKASVKLGCTTFIEIGPQPVLSALAMMNNDTELLCLPSLKKNENEWETLLNTLGKLYVKGFEIDWKGVDAFYERKKVSLPHYPFIGKKFWPDVQSSLSTTIHPLLGSVISNASTTKLFQCDLNLKKLTYISDHVIGDKIVFPGAGYLEMCLAAGHASLHGSTNSLPPPSFAMKVENLIIEAPLQLQDSKPCQVQTTVELSTSTQNQEFNVRIYRKLDSASKKWLPHANASFSPLPTSEEKRVPIDTKIFRETLARTPDQNFATRFYDDVANAGLKFGPIFKSLESVWNDADTKKLVIKVKLPPSEESKTHYIVHPVILDAMIQSIIMIQEGYNLKKKLYVPIKIGKFIWLSAINSSEIFIHAFNSASKNEGTAVLLDRQGKVLAVMSSVEFIDTTVKAIEAALEEQTTSMPDMWEEIWVKDEGSLEQAVDWEKVKGKFYTEEFFHKVQTTYNQLPPQLSETFSLLQKLAYLYILKTLHNCGWKPEVGQIIEENFLFLQLKIQNNHRRYFKFMLNVLEHEGILQKVDGVTWKVVRIPRSPEEIQVSLSSPIFKSELVERFRPTLLLIKFGENLAGILRGEKSALPILFPEQNSGSPSVADLYNDYGEVFKEVESSIQILRQRVSHIREKMNGNPFVMRILEVGAGTGSYTSHILSFLEEEGIEFEYTFTDISNSFFPAAEKRFEKHGKRMKFQKFNLEEDPIDQGFIPEYFDCVFMAEVIHATRDIKESLRNVRMIMKPFAKLDLLETNGVVRFITFLFGSLEGYWRFQDFDLRPDVCALSIEAWNSVLNTSGFEVDGIFPIVNSHHAHIYACKTATDPHMISSIPKSSKVWLVFHDSSSPISTFLVRKIRETTTRKVVAVTAGNEFQDDGESFTIRKFKEEDYITLLNTIESQGLTLEGILYCWALDKRLVSQEEILQPYFYLAKAIITSEFRNSPRLTVLLNEGIAPLDANDSSHFYASTLLGFTKSLKNENVELECKCIEVATSYQNENTRMQEVFHEIWRSEKDGHTIVAFHDNSRYSPKLQPLKPTQITDKSLSLPKGTNRFQLVLPETKLISDLQFGLLDSPSLLMGDEVEVQIKASALNFRDVLCVIKPTDRFKDVNAVGIDVVGVVQRVGENVTKWKVGDRVSGCNFENRSLPSHMIFTDDQLMRIPDNMTFSEASTIPAVYSTSVVGLLEVAKLKKEDVVLIHAAAGGVGLSAIEICKHVRCTVIATVGSKRKYNYLRKLGVQHIFNSRNTEYANQILEATNGRGVDVVLNSLTSEGFKEATLKACAKGARFVELSKMNVWTVEEVKEIRPDVEYTITDIIQTPRKEWSEVLRKMCELQEKNVVKPISHLRFDALNIREALEYLQKAKHIGKIVCVMPELKKEGGEIKVVTPMFNEESTYLNTGGLGGIGFVVCQWMIENGAKHVVLAGRSLPTPNIQSKINELNSKGAFVVPVKLDVGNFEQCKDLIEIQIPKLNLPPLKGVMHSAGTLADGLVINQNWEKLSSTFTTKINGTLNLHELTKSKNLEHFVLFSSMAANFGHPGQCNHSAGNAFEDAFTHYRKSIGLPATTINWGPWGEVGAAIEADFSGFKGLSNLQGITALEFALKTHREQTSVFGVSSSIFRRLCPHPSFNKYLDDRLFNKSGPTLVNSGSGEASKFWDEYDATADKPEVMRSHVRNTLRSILKLDQNDVIGDDVDMKDLGMDSLMFVEIKNRLQTLFGDRLSITAGSIRESKTVKLLATTLISLIESKNIIETQKPTIEEVNKLIREDCQLPEHIRAQINQKVESINNVKKVLLTGSTGNFGPYVLKELTNLPQITQVICLMRHSKRETGEERLHKVLNKLELLPQVDMGKVRCVTGNVAEPQLGMKPNEWEDLSQNVDAVFHCAALVEHVGYYRKTSSNSDMRAVNIRGTKNVLEFACKNKLKHVYHASTVLAVSKLDENGRVSEKWPEVGDFDGATTIGYSITKFVGDVLMKQGVERGIPCKVFRFPLISGDSVTGRCSIENNHTLLRYLFVMKTGIMSSAPFVIPMLPVDICAKVSLQIFYDETASPDLYNITPAFPNPDQKFADIAKEFGFNVDIVEFSQFSKRVVESGGEVSALEVFKELYSDEDEVLKVTARSPVLGVGKEEGELELRNKWRSQKVAKLVPNFFEDQKQSMDYVRQDLLFCKSQGWFKRFGL